MGKSYPLRNEQFEKIARLKEFFFQQGFPVWSIDTKKKNSSVIFIVVDITMIVLLDR